MKDPSSGSVVGGYRLERRIGRGGMGVVYEAVDLELGRQVAVKLIAPERAGDPEFRQRFMDESRLAASIEHPSVLPVYRAAEIDGVLFLAMRLIVGEDLATLVKREGRLPAPRAVAIVAQVAGALDAAHERQLVHRDVKPANVLLGRDQRAYLGDFGVAMDQRRAHSHTASGLIVGTADYIAPEQVRDGPIGPWTDVYALGCVLFFLLTGRVVFPLRTSEQRLWAHAVEEPPHVTALREELPAGLDGVLERALAKSTQDRWQSAGALADAAREAIESEQTTLGNALPVTRYAKSGTVNIAYQVIGDGPRDVVLVPGWISHVEHSWENPASAAFLRRLASTSRLITFDKRGTGLSDRPERVPDVEERMDDIAAVMAAVGSERAALVGLSEGGAISSLFAATYPHAVSALVLYAANAKCTQTDDYPWGYTPEQAISMFTDYIERSWGSGDGLAVANPSVAGDPEVKRWSARGERLGASPGAALALWITDTEMDVRAALPAVQAPTLVIHRAGDRFVPVGHGRYLAEHIPGARYLELSGEDHNPWFGDSERLLDAIERFLAGAIAPPAIDRVLATVMVTRLRAGGVSAAAVRGLIAEFGGTADETAGGALLGAFDGPARAIRSAAAIATHSARLGCPVGIGLDAGACRLRGERLTGSIVDRATRIAALAVPGEILATPTVKDLVAGSGIGFEARGDRRIQGPDEPWPLLAVDQGDAETVARPPPTSMD